MRLTTPHMGNIFVALEALVTELGHDYVTPPPCSQRTLDLGTKYSPESACLPLKINVGNFLEAVEGGAEGIIMAGGSGPCRFGYYAEVQRQILHRIGKDVEIIVLEPPQENMERLRRQVRRLLGRRGLNRLIAGCRLAWEKLKATEQLEHVALQSRSREQERGSVSRCLSAGIDAIRQASSIKAIRRVTLEFKEQMDSLASKVPAQPILRVGIVGEIYTVLEPFVNLKLEERLGELGVDVVRTIALDQWIRDHLVKQSLHLYSNLHLRAKAANYLAGFVGGHGLESVAHTISLAESGCDGVIHLLPFTCMPEIVAQSVLTRVGRDYSIPILTLVVDEHTGEAGFQTRIEAFVDLLSRSRKEKGHTDEKVRISRG